MSYFLCNKKFSFNLIRIKSSFLGTKRIKVGRRGLNLEMSKYFDSLKSHKNLEKSARKFIGIILTSCTDERQEAK